MSEFKAILYEKKEGVAIITLNRPDAANAMSEQMTREFEAAMHRAGDDEEVRVIIVTAAGKVFSAGGDAKEFLVATPETVEKFNRMTIGIWRYMELLRKPIIAAVNGFANIELIQAVDLVIAAEEASFALPEVTIGVSPGAGITIRLPRLVGRFLAKQLLLTGDRISAQEAYRIGLVNKVVPREKLMDEAMALGRRLTKNAPLAMGAAKACVNVGSEMSIDQGMEFQMQESLRTFASEDVKEGIKARIIEKREPQFKGK